LNVGRSEPSPSARGFKTNLLAELVDIKLKLVVFRISREELPRLIVRDYLYFETVVISVSSSVYFYKGDKDWFSKGVDVGPVLSLDGAIIAGIC
jgi:hypothetical protein